MTYEAGTIVPILRMRKLRHRNDMLLAKGPLSDQALAHPTLMLRVTQLAVTDPRFQPHQVSLLFRPMSASRIVSEVRNILRFVTVGRLRKL